MPAEVYDLIRSCRRNAEHEGVSYLDHERLAPSPLRSAMRYFGPELDDHILRSTCPAGVCHPIAVTVGAPA